MQVADEVFLHGLDCLVGMPRKGIRSGCILVNFYGTEFKTSKANEFEAVIMFRRGLMPNSF